MLCIGLVPRCMVSGIGPWCRSSSRTRARSFSPSQTHRTVLVLSRRAAAIPRGHAAVACRGAVEEAVQFSPADGPLTADFSPRQLAIFEQFIGCPLLETDRRRDFRAAARPC